ncbi:hypothetical protein L4C36_21895 [Photobacterium japonica]|uniref:hypothetical protein n=1 Tax=Photobacterium japonica TaxID=2910235 RepID=UPI003D12CB53
MKAKYYQYAKSYIENYNKKIDCADLAIVMLIDFANKNNLPVKFKYYADGWKWLNFSSDIDDVVKFKSKAMRMLGALNVIDNTVSVAISSAKSGDLIMSRWSSTLGHTRIIHSIKQEESGYKVVWYQGNLPAVIPEKREALFSNIDGVYASHPRRWNFEQFNA